MAVTAKTYPKILMTGLQASYDALATKDSNVLYFCSDTRKVYKGSADYTEAVRVASTKPTSPVAGIAYILGDTGTVESYDGSAWHVLSYPLVEVLNADSDATHVPSAKTVYDFVESEIAAVTGGAQMVSKIEQSATQGVITYTTGDSNTHNVTLTGVVTTPTYDAATRKFTFPVTGGDDLVVELGKDIFVDPDANNGYNADTKTIDIYLNDGATTAEDTKISIPATALIDIYTGKATNSISVTVSDTNEISAAAVIRPDSTATGSEFTNALKVGDTGLYVDLSAYATTAYVDTEIARVEGKADTNATDIATLKSAVNTLNGDSTTEGSVDYKIAASQTTLQGNIDQNTADIASLASSTSEWGTF